MEYNLSLAESILKENTDVYGWVLFQDGTFIIVIEDSVELHGQLPKYENSYEIVLNNTVAEGLSDIKVGKLRQWRDGHGR